MRLVGVIHLAALPGSPRGERTVDEIARAAAADARSLEDAGFDGVIVENFGDVPFLKTAPKATVAAMTVCALRVNDAAPRLSLGVNVLRNDAEAALAVALASGARFIRVNVHTGARVTDQGIIEGDAGETLRLRRALGASALVWADVDVKHSAPLGARALADEAADAAVRGMADALLVTGEGTGKEVATDELDAVRRAVHVPVLVASGARAETLSRLAGHCDGVIVGSDLRADGKAGGPIDPARARAFATSFRTAFSRA